jgi:hypothetical protein
MSSLKDGFNELLERIRLGRGLETSGFEPVYYLVYPPQLILDVKRQIPAWTARLKNDGWDVHVISVAEHILSILQDAPLRSIWLKADAKSPMDWHKTNQSLANALINGSLLKLIEEELRKLKKHSNAILLVTDIEALHPYTRIGVLEGQLQGQFSVPTVFFYPGERTGKTRLKFLGFYHEDGNYRSVHVG